MSKRLTWVEWVWTVSISPSKNILFDTEEDALEYISGREKVDKSELKVDGNEIHDKDGFICFMVRTDVWQMV